MEINGVQILKLVVKFQQNGNMPVILQRICAYKIVMVDNICIIFKKKITSNFNALYQHIVKILVQSEFPIKQIQKIKCVFKTVVIIDKLIQQMKIIALKQMIAVNLNLKLIQQ